MLRKLIIRLMLWPLKRAHPMPWRVHSGRDGLWVHDAKGEPVWYAGTGKEGLKYAEHLVALAKGGRP